MPSGFRRRLEDGCVLTKGQDRQVVLFPTGEFEARAAEVTGAQNAPDADPPRSSRGRPHSSVVPAADQTRPEGLRRPGDGHRDRRHRCL